MSLIPSPMPPKAQFAAKSSEHALACKLPFRIQSQGTGFVYWLVGWLVGWFFSGIDNKIVCVHVGSRFMPPWGGFNPFTSVLSECLQGIHGAGLGFPHAGHHITIMLC